MSDLSIIWQEDVLPILPVLITFFLLKSLEALQKLN